ncbi:MAG: hypothetical protein WA773_10545 [Bradyrhizobium sp.]|uniref:hypothetical protein n=2 Tax=Bradyrhizobium sp. TaxID=376 RepID=UPI003BAF7BA1
MMAVSSSTSTPTTLAQALTKLAADEAAKASAKVITTDESEVSQLEKTQTSSTLSTSSQSTGVNVIA